MKTQIVSAARWAAVLKLQNIRDKKSPQSFGFEIADYAIELVLSPERSEDKYLVKNALKDARSILIRRKRRERERGMLSLTEEDNVETAFQIENDPLVTSSLPPSPERVLVWKQELANLSKATPVRTPRVERVLLGWRNGESIRETAFRLNCSTHYVKKLRAQIRTKALKLKLRVSAA